MQESWREAWEGGREGGGGEVEQRREGGGGGIDIRMNHGAFSHRQMFHSVTA